MSNPTNHAFPTGSWEYDGNGNVLPYQEAGLSKRELFAAMAMNGYLASYAGLNCPTPSPEKAAEAAVSYADALLQALEAKEGK